MQKPDAPIANLLLTVQFAPPTMNLNPIQLGDVFAPFREEYPIFEQIGRAGPMPVEPGVVAIQLPFGAARISFSTIDRQWTILFQEDRFSFGWNRTSSFNSPSNYPGFSDVLGRALPVWEKLRLGNPHSTVPIVPQVGEIVYTDYFAIGGNHSADRLSSIFNLINPSFTLPMSSYSFNWTQPFAGDGFSQIQISGPSARPDGVVVSKYETTCRFKLSGDWDAVASRFEVGHQWALTAFNELINPSFRPM